MQQQSERGGMVVEFALIAPILLVLVCGIIEFGILLVNQAIITNASREAARAGIVVGTPRPNCSAICSVANAYLTNAGLTGTATLTVQNVTTGSSCTTCGTTPMCSAFQNDLRVRVNYPHRFWALPSLIAGFSTTMTLGATATMKCE